jgi:hypothetical protein
MELTRGQLVEESPVGIVTAGGGWFARPTAGRLLLTSDELVVVSGPDDSPEVLMRQGRADLAMIRRPTARGGEHVELASLDGQQATLRFDRAHARSASAVARWLAGLPVST